MKTAIVMPPGSRFCVNRPNSMETVVRTLAEARERQDDFRIFCCEGAEKLGDLPVHTLPGRGRARLLALIDALKDYQPDLIEFHQQVNQAVKVAPSFRHAVRILYRHNVIKTSPNPWDRFRYYLRYKRMDGLIFVSHYARTDFQGAFPRLNGRAHAVPNPIHAELWRGDVQDRDRIIAFAGRATSQKGVHLICEALPGVLDRNPEWRAVLMLSDWEEHADWVRPHVAALDRYGEQVTIMRSAPLGDVRQVMKRAAIALTPSTGGEALGLTALEAHAAGAALISSGRGGLREASGPHALYVDDLTVANLGAAMERLIKDPDERLTLARGAQAYVFETHVPGLRAAQLDALRDQLVQAKRAAQAGGR